MGIIKDIINQVLDKICQILTGDPGVNSLCDFCAEQGKNIITA